MQWNFITEDDIASVMTEAPPFPVEDTAVKISRDGTIAVTAAVTRQALTDLSNWYPAKLRTALLFAGALKLYGAWSAAVSNGNPALPAGPSSWKASPARADRSGTPDAFVAQWNTRIGTAGLTPQTIQWQVDGEAVLLG